MTAIVLPAPLQRRVEVVVRAMLEPAGLPADLFASPRGEPALSAPDSLAWQLFKNPAALFIGGVAAVLLELAEPRVRTGVWEHTRFREQPVQRLQRTGLAAMLTVYGPRSRTEAMIAAVSRRHMAIAGSTPTGEAYRASDPELLEWVHATASFGIVEATHAYVRPLSVAERDRYFFESRTAARLYGAPGVPASQAELDALLAAMAPRLEGSATVFEFLHILARAPALPAPLRPLQGLLVRAGVEIVPGWLRERLGLGTRWGLRPWERGLVILLARGADRVLLRSSPPVQACRRLGLPDDYLYSRPPRP
ncbi:oxygenase MpaB family protein [Azohydromonas caseinilytica]|uniref:DUF2236 domain-containing protein n=1 Tax=Azohydromonas caseinilytica TaxID=2728836 RepID=A0A848FDE8_9BURK|nr:oxygenase MpaB family protein [Azohydromonas caseinilytica]NML15951.1 DUF2236 domain-containing protein [Azohydromonas caseinilytica]